MKSSSHSIRSHITLVSMGFALILAILVAGGSYAVSQHFLRSNQVQSTRNNLQLLGNELDLDLTNIILFVSGCTLDSEIINYLNVMNGTKPNTSAANDKQLTLNTWTRFQTEFNQIRSRDYLGRSIISTMDGRHFIQIQPSPGGDKGPVPLKLMQAPFFSELLSAERYSWIGIVENPLSKYNNPFMIPILRPITSQYSSHQIGWIYVEISPEIILSRFKSLQLAEDSAVYLTMGDQYTYRFDGTQLVADALPANVVSYRLPDYDWTLSQLLSEQELAVQKEYFYAIIAAVVFCIVLIGFGTMLLLNRMITLPVNALIQKLKRVGLGDFSRDAGIEWDNEMGEIGRGINVLSENVQALMHKKVQDEKTRQELEYKILQSQINPHFLYNTLNSIKWMATIQGSDGIADMTTALSRLMKNVAKGSDSLIPLRDELALLNDYFTIMRYRYGGTVALEQQIDADALLDCKVHRFSLQPIVENAIFHGIEPKGGAGTIRLHIYESHIRPDNTASSTAVQAVLPADHDVSGSTTEGSNRRTKQQTGAETAAAPALLHCLMIDITDNGIGMDEETIQKVLAGDDSGGSNDFFKHVGVANVRQRIQFTFGRDYGISVKSTPGSGTTMRFTLPYLTEGDAAQQQSH